MNSFGSNAQLTVLEDNRPNGSELATELIDSGDSETLAVTRTGLRIAPTLSFDDWQRVGKRISRLADLSAWCLGDWLTYGECRYSGRYRQAVEMVGLNYQTLRNYAWVARRFELSRRRDKLSFQHHMEVARLPRDEQDRWLDDAVLHGWTTSELRRRIRERELPEKAAGDENRTALVPRIRADREQVIRWRTAAERSNMDLASWIMASLDLAARNALDGVADRTVTADVEQKIPHAR